MRNPLLLTTRWRLFSFVGLIHWIKDSAGFDRPCSRSPPEGKLDRLFNGESHVFEMIANNVAVIQVMMILDQTVIETFKGGVADQLELDRLEL